MSQSIDKKWGPNNEFLPRGTITEAVAFFREARREYDALIDAEVRGPNSSK
jgi:hypothetical protein